MWRTAFLAWPLAYGAFSGTKIEVARVSCAHPTVLDDIVGNYLAVNQPVVIEANCTSSWIHKLDPAWFDDAAGDSGHTVVMVPSEVRNEYVKWTRFPWTEGGQARWSITAAWGGKVGFLKDGGGAHVDRNCDFFFALQMRGTKKWFVYQPRSPAVYSKTYAFVSDIRYETEVHFGEIFLWPPWLTHATEIVEPKSFSLNGMLSLDDRLSSMLDKPDACRKGTPPETLAKWLSGSDEHGEL